MYGGAFTKKNEQASFTCFNLDHFFKLRVKSSNVYFKANYGFCNYSSKSRVWEYYDGTEFVIEELPKGYEYRNSCIRFLIGTGLDFKAGKKFTLGFDLQYMPSFNDNLYISEVTPPNDSAYFDIALEDVLPLISASYNMEYTLKRFGFKYSFLLTPTSDRFIHQFGITYNLKYDWSEVAQ